MLLELDNKQKRTLLLYDIKVKKLQDWRHLLLRFAKDFSLTAVLSALLLALNLVILIMTTNQDISPSTTKTCTVDGYSFDVQLERSAVPSSNALSSVSQHFISPIYQHLLHLLQFVMILKFFLSKMNSPYQQLEM